MRSLTRKARRPCRLRNAGCSVASACNRYEEPTWGISLNVKNFTDQRYYVAANAAVAFVGEPLSALIKIYIKQ
jgi:outer membrane receptor for ferric coprogen and ferric-rhodotorulic acid